MNCTDNITHKKHINMKRQTGGNSKLLIYENMGEKRHSMFLQTNGSPKRIRKAKRLSISLCGISN